MTKRYTARTLAGATRRVRQLEDQICVLDAIARRYRDERRLLAMLAARTPQFDNPLVVMEVEKLRDEILRKGAP